MDRAVMARLKRIPAIDQPFRFQGQQFDEETGPYFNRFRYFDPGVGRFASQDPIGLRGGVNLFQYAPAPTGRIDPWGLAGTIFVNSKGIATVQPEITPGDLTGKSRTEIRDLANKKGLTPKKHDSNGEPIKWTCPCTGKERLRLDRGHIDPKAGRPYNDPKAAVDHVHGYDGTGNKIRSPVDGNTHFPTTGN